MPSRARPTGDQPVRTMNPEADNQSVDQQSRFTPARRLMLALTAALYLAAAAAAFFLIDREVFAAALSMPGWLIVALPGLSLVNYAARVWRWIFMSGELQLGAPVGRNALYYLSGYALTSTPGKAGEAIRMWYLKKGHGIDLLRSLPLMAADRLLDMWAVFALAILSVAGFAEYRWHTAVLGGVILTGSAPFLAPRAALNLVRRIGTQVPFVAKIADGAAPAVAAMQALNRWRVYLIAFAPSLAGWLAECAGLYLLLRHFGADVSFLNAIFVFSFGMIVGAVSFLPGGLGGAEATMVLLLKAVGVDLSVAIAATAICRIVTFWFAVLIGVALTPFAMRAALGPGAPPGAITAAESRNRA